MVPTTLGKRSYAPPLGRAAAPWSNTDIYDRSHLSRLLDPIDRISQAALVPATDRSLEFQRLIADSASRLVNAPSDQLAEAIVSSLRDTVDILKVDGAIVWKLDAD